MLRDEVLSYVKAKYGVEPDHPWPKYEYDEVLRHKDSRKWFALLMRIERSRLALSGDGEIWVVNLKCDPVMSGSLRMIPGIFPAYHMNHATWISVLLDGTVDKEQVFYLIDVSFDLTASKKKKPTHSD